MPTTPSPWRVCRALLFAALILVVVPGAAVADDAALSGANTAWLLTSTALVLFMTLPGLALFYAGLVQARNVLSVMMHCVAICCLASVLWYAVGYAIAFGDGGAAQAWWGGLAKAFLGDLNRDTLKGDIPESVFFMFQMTFAIITPALIIGAYPERVRFPAVLLFSGAWLLAVYAPVAHWVWGGGWLAGQGVLDFAGGLVVHASAGSSALVFAWMLGPRAGFPRQLHPPHSPGMTMAGAAMLWVGWYGFNAGSALAAGTGAGMALTVTHLSAATAALVWMALEWRRFGRPSLVGIVTGVVAGLATITPASGYVGPIAGLCFGLVAGAVCYFAVDAVKHRLQIDDSLDVFAVHGIGGILGTLLTAVFASASLGGGGYAEGMTMLSQLGAQALGTLMTVAWSVLATWGILKLVAAFVGLRVDAEQATQGLDLASHGESGYNL